MVMLLGAFLMLNTQYGIQSEVCILCNTLN